MVSDDIVSVLSTALGGTVEKVYDAKLPDQHVLADPVIVVHSISDVPETAINGPIVRREGRWQVSVHARDLPTLRSVKAAVIAALHGYSGGAIVYAEFESAPGELFEADTIPFEYHAPVDFLIQF